MINMGKYMTKPIVLNKEQIDKLYEDSYERTIEKDYDYLIKRYLDEEKEAKKQASENHKRYMENNYIKIGGN